MKKFIIPNVGEFAGWKHHESIEESKKILDMFIADKQVLAIVYQNKVIGSIGIEEYDENGAMKTVKITKVGLDFLNM